MAPVSHQTIKLSKGKHASPEDGACVMELTSMLAGEPFTDHPSSACPVIGSFLRAYNDSVDDGRRQDLYALAARIVGSRGSIHIQRARSKLLANWALEVQRRHWTRRYLPFGRLRMANLRRQPSAHAVGTFAVRAISKHTQATHREVLDLLEKLLAIGVPAPKSGADMAEDLPAALYPVI